MNPAKVVRGKVAKFTDLPNIGPASARDFELLGFTRPSQLVGADPWHLYQALCVASGTRQDPCVLDVLMSVTDFLGGAEPRPWWDYTNERKRRYGNLLAVARPATSASANEALSDRGRQATGRGLKPAGRQVPARVRGRGLR